MCFYFGYHEAALKPVTSMTAWLIHTRPHVSKTMGHIYQTDSIGSASGTVGTYIGINSMQ